MRKSIVVLLSMLFCITTISAQKKVMQKMKASAESFIEKPLVVVLLTEKEEYIQKFNTYMKEAIRSEWDLNTGIEFITEEEFNIIRKDKNSNKAYIRYYDNTEKNTIKDPDKYNEALYFGTVEEKSSFHIEPVNLRKNMSPTEFYVLFQNARNTIEKLANYTYEKMSKKDIQKLYAKQAEISQPIKDEKLYICKNIVDKGLETTINKLYKYNYEIVDLEVIETAVLNNYENFYYLTKSTIRDADTGQVMLAFTPPNAKIKLVSPLDAYKTDKLTKKDIENLVLFLN